MKTKFQDIKDEHGFRIKSFDIFNQETEKDDETYNVQLETDLPEMNSVKDFATWMVKKIPLEQKLKVLESYNNNKLNELIVEYYNENSDAIIEIIDSYDESIESVLNILEKISFLIESIGDVEILGTDDEQIAYYIDLDDKNKRTFIYDIENMKFRLTSLNKF